MTKAERLLDGWRPKVPVEDGLSRAIAYFKGLLDG